MVIGCSGGSPDGPTKAATISEYASRVCDPVDLPEGFTWGQTRDKLETDIERGENVIPLEEVSDYHYSALAAMKATLLAIEGKDSKSVANPFELADNSAWLLKVSVMEGAENELSAETVQILNAAGCNVGEDT